MPVHRSPDEPGLGTPAPSEAAPSPGSAPAPAPAAPASAGKPGSPSGARRAAMPASSPKVAAPRGDSKTSLAFRRYLLLGILLACVILVALIGYRLYLSFAGRPRSVNIPVDAELELITDRAKAAQSDILKIEEKVWKEKAEPTPQDLKTIKEKRNVLEACHKDFEEKIQLIRAKVGGEQGSYYIGMIGDKILKVKLWIWDADGVLEKPKPPESAGGLYIRMYLALTQYEKIKNEAQEIQRKKEEVLKRNDAQEKKGLWQKANAFGDELGRIAQTLYDLEEEVRKGLAREDLDPKVLQDLGTLRESTALAMQALNMVRALKADFSEAKQ